MKNHFLKRSLLSVMLIFTALSISSCTRIGPGYEGLKVSMAGGDRGSAEISPAFGWTWYNPLATTVIEVNTRNQHYLEEHPLMVQAHGGTNVTVHPSFNYAVIPGSANTLYLKWGVTDNQEIEGKLLETSLLTSCREVTNTWTVDSLLNNRAAYDQAISLALSKKLEPYITIFQLTSGVTPDTTMAKSIAAKAASVQDQQAAEAKRLAQISLNSIDIANAQRDSAVAVIKAQGEAEAIKKKQAAITNTYVDYIKWSNWDGKLPQYQLGNASMLMSMPGSK